MTIEEGKTVPEAKGEVMRAINIFRYFGGEAARLTGETVPSERDGVFCFTIRKPRGVDKADHAMEFSHRYPRLENRARAADLR